MINAMHYDMLACGITVLEYLYNS